MKFIWNYFIWIWPPNFIWTSYELHEKLPDNSCIFPTKFVWSSCEVHMNRKFLLHMYFKWSSCELHMNFICNYVWNIEVAMIFICISFEVHMTHRPELSNEISYEWYEPSVVVLPRNNKPLVVCFTKGVYITKLQLESNCWLAWAQVCWMNSLWACLGLINFLSCLTYFLLFPGLDWSSRFHTFADKPMMRSSSNLVGKLIMGLFNLWSCSSEFTLSYHFLCSFPTLIICWLADLWSAQRPLTSLGTSAWLYRVTTQYSYYIMYLVFVFFTFSPTSIIVFQCRWVKTICSVYTYEQVWVCIKRYVNVYFYHIETCCFTYDIF